MRNKASKSKARAVWGAVGTVASCAGTQLHDRAGWRGVGGLGDRGSGERNWRRLG